MKTKLYSEVLDLYLSNIAYTFEQGGVRKIKPTKGNNYTGLCPLHNDHNPSFSFNDKGLWICHAGCGQGNIFDFYAEVLGQDKSDFYELLLKMRSFL